MWKATPQPIKHSKHSSKRKLRSKVGRIFTDGSMEQVKAVFDAIEKNKAVL